MKKATYEIIETAVGTYTVRVRQPGRKTSLLHDGFRTREGAADWIKQLCRAEPQERTPLGPMRSEVPPQHFYGPQLAK